MLKCRDNTASGNACLNQRVANAFGSPICLNPALSVLQVHMRPHAMDALETVPSLIHDQEMAAITVEHGERMIATWKGVEAGDFAKCSFQNLSIALYGIH